MSSSVAKINLPSHTATRNACKLCAPLGASLVFKGIAGAVPLLHGSQGCSTYIRRYFIGHFREPADIASSSFSEETTIFGGGANLRTAITNIVKQYHPACIGIATTCLAETIGEDIKLHLHGMEATTELPPIVHVSTPSYAGSHIDGFINAVKALIDRFSVKGTPDSTTVTMLPGMLSCAELRFLRNVCSDFGARCIMIPDYAETLDGGIWSDYKLLPPGGTTTEELAAAGSSAGSIDFSGALLPHRSAGLHLEKKCGVPSFRTRVPIGIDASDAFFDAMSTITHTPVPAQHTAARQRLVDAYIDAHKVAAEKRVILYGDLDQVAALAGFLSETGINIAAVVTGDPDASVKTALSAICGNASDTVIIHDGDFEDIKLITSDLKPDLLIGNSKGYALARAANIPLIRTGFPVHDRIGGQRLMHIGYEGTMQLFDTIINTLIEQMQSGSTVGYMTW